MTSMNNIVKTVLEKYSKECIPKYINITGKALIANILLSRIEAEEFIKSQIQKDNDISKEQS